MCGECLKVPCAERCPNADHYEPPVKYWCSVCHKEILAGQDYYSLPEGKTVCPDCMDSFYIESS